MIIIVATEGNLEVAGAYNAITGGANAIGKALSVAGGYRELTDPETARMVMELVKMGYIDLATVRQLGITPPLCPSREKRQ